MGVYSLDEKYDKLLGAIAELDGRNSIDELQWIIEAESIRREERHVQRRIRVLQDQLRMLQETRAKFFDWK